MLRLLIEFHLRHRLLIPLGLAAVVAAGTWVIRHIPIEAFPDLTNNQVVVITECGGMAPREVEQLVTFPIETSLMGIPKTEIIRSISKLGLSMVTVVLDDSVPIYFARQLINERLQEARSRLPEGIDPHMGPVATAFGEVYQYTVEGPASWSSRDLKSLHEWQIKNILRSVPGVSEVNTWGGESLQIQIEVDPQRLLAYGLTLRDVFNRVRENNSNFSAGYIEHASEQYTVLGLGRARQAGDLGRIVLLASRGTPVLLSDVARISEGALQRQGSTTRDGRGETVSGMIIMLKGANGRDVIERVKEKLASLSLPAGVRLVPFYDQSDVIDGTIATVRKNLLEAGLLVATVLLVFLGNLRAAFLVAAAIPISMLVGFLGMAVFGISANLMSLGAIDFGMIVDGAVVMMENSIHRLQSDSHGGVTETIRDASLEVARPITFGVGIIIAVYLPVLFLEGLEGRMFRPMAITVCSALIGSLAFALTVVPGAAAWLLRKGIRPHSGAWFRPVQSLYLRILDGAIRMRPLVIGAALACVTVAVWSLTVIGTEFMPRLDEGSILITTRKLPGISLTNSVAMNRDVERVVMSFPEVRSVVTKLGRPDLATEAMGVYEGDVYILLHPRDRWKAQSKEQLIERMSTELERIPGISYNFTQPMAMRLDEVVSGIKADLALKIFGDDPDTLERLATRALRIIGSIPGAADSQRELTTGVAELRIEIDRPAIARYALNVSDVRDAVEAAVRGQHVSELVLNQRRIPIAVKLPAEYTDTVSALGDLSLTAPSGLRVRLDQVARLSSPRGPEVISREHGQRRIVIQSNVRGRDLGSFADEARLRVAAELPLPPGYFTDWGGQFENQERATQRLLIVVPLSLAIISALLMATFHSVRQALLIMMIVPFALVGGVAALWLRGINLNLSASVGFIALSGVAVLNGIVMVSAINRLRESGLEINEAIRQGAASRLRPVLMTALVASLGFIPMALSTSTGAEVQRPLASVVIGGLFSATPLTLFLLPLIYPFFSPAPRSTAPLPPESASLPNS